jgi:hypothetical protein
VPAVIPAHVALRSRLRDTITLALGLNTRLEAITAIKTRQPSGIFHGKIDHSQFPGNVAAINTILDLHALARETEIWFRIALKLPEKHRGGSSANTRKALEAVARLAEGAADHAVKEHTRAVDKWCTRALVVLGVIEAPRKIPRQPGQPDPKCPFCKDATLRSWPMGGEIRCISPTCRDEGGRKPSARMEYSAHVGDFVLVWQDGISGVPV